MGDESSEMINSAEQVTLSGSGTIIRDSEDDKEVPEVHTVGESDNPSYFDGITLENQQAVRIAEKRLKTQLDIHSKSTLAIGKYACEIKRILGHGRFEGWVDAECPCSLATIERCMNAWVRFGHQPDRIAALQKSDLCDLAAPCVPDSFREQVLTDLDQGRKFTRGEMKREIKAARGLIDSSDVEKKSGRVTPREKKCANYDLSENYHRELTPNDGLLADWIIDRVCDDADEFLRLYPETDGRRVLQIVAHSLNKTR